MKEQKQTKLTLKEKAKTEKISSSYLNQTRNEGGITLIALVVTIIILLILAGVTLATVLSDGGLIDKTKEAIGEQERAQEKEQEDLGKLAGMLGNALNELGSTGGTKPVTPPTPPEDDDTPLVSTVTSTEHEDNKKVQDSLGNPLVIPSGFKYVTGTNVEDGIVIEDADQNQFVWIPVSNIDGDNDASNNDTNDENLIKLESGEKVEITLGRYTFSTNNTGTPMLVQNGANHGESKETSIIKDSYNYEYYENTNSEDERPNGGARAKDLGEFVKSVQDNFGYYLARYEAGKGTGDRPVSKVGAVWNSITQQNASVATQKMYEGEENYTSDLVNSYAWDTAIVYIQAMKEENKNYANATSTNSSLKSTGATGDEKCHIFDMAGNVYEWTTEYSAVTSYGINYCCVHRGASYDLSNQYSPASRHNFGTTRDYNTIGFRPLLYLK